MMDHFKGVDVEVISNGQILPLYNDPDTPDGYNSRERQRYIEATTGAIFSVKVTLNKKFRFGASQAARVSIGFDGSTPWYSTIEKKAWLHSHRETHCFSNFVTFCPASSTWKRREFTFGRLDITESTSTRVDATQLKALGQIRLFISRVNLQTAPQPVAKSQLSRVSEVTEKTLKGSAISSTVSYTDGETVGQPVNRKTACLNIPGRLGETGTFNLLYRSKRTLQMLGCLPRTPSPEAEPASIINNPTEATSHKENTTVGPKDRDQEIRNLRARLAQLEDGENVKSELSHTAGGIKRERSQNNQSPSSGKRSRKSGPPETIDLTGD